jgi:ABC-2 type transport system permease protein
MRRAATIAHLTFLEARRRWIAPAAVLCGLAFILIYGIALFFIYRHLPPGFSPQRQMQLQFFTLAGLYVAYFLTIAVAILLAVDTLSGEIGSGVMQTIASKPIHRAEILLGKFLTHWLMAAVYLGFTAGGVLLAAYLITGFAQPRVFAGLPFLLLGATTMVAVSTAGSARLTTVTNGIVAFGFYGLAFIGGWIEQIGGFAQSEAARRIGTAISLLSPVDALWRRAAYDLQPPIMRSLPITPFGVASVPSDAMTVWAVAFALLALGIALRQFQRRPL